MQIEDRTIVAAGAIQCWELMVVASSTVDWPTTLVHSINGDRFIPRSRS